MLRKIVYDAYHNNFTSKAKALEKQYKRKYTRRRQSAPSTVFGRALTVGEELSIIKEYNESQAKKKQSKEQRAVVRERKQREKVVSEHKDLHEANVILKKCHTRIEVKKSLRKRHLVALLRDLNATADLLKSGRDVMFQAYWERREGESGDNDVSIIERTSKPHALASCTSRMNSYHHVSSPIHRLPSLTHVHCMRPPLTCVNTHRETHTHIPH